MKINEEMMKKALHLKETYGKLSVTFLQFKMKVSFEMAKKLIEEMEDE